jgi:2-iminobutanoate/2-iminopropanoate deaminase
MRSISTAPPSRPGPLALTLIVIPFDPLVDALTILSRVNNHLYGRTMMSSFRVSAGVAAVIVASVVFASAPAAAQNQHMEIIHHPNYDKTVFMPFVPAIKIKSGKILWLAGTTALPVYHDHPHKRDEIQQYMTNDLEAQTRRAMDGIKQTLESAGASFKDVVHVFVLRARPRMGDIGKASAVINSYFAPFNHKPTSTNVAVLELGEPEQLIEIQMFAVVD